MKSPKIVVVGAGIGGLSSAIELAAAGAQVTLLERQSVGGGKIRRPDASDLLMDAGPTVMTMPWVFEDIFRTAGRDFHQSLSLAAMPTLAHHRWRDGTRLDLYSDLDTTSAAIADFAGDRSAGQYRQFMQRAQRVYDLLEPTFMTQQQAGLTGLLRRCGISALPGLASLSPFRSLWSLLGASFSEPKLRQLFARYATYCGSSPFLAPSTLMLIAHVENKGVWRIDGGMRALASALVACAGSLGVDIQFNVDIDNVLVRDGRARGVSAADGTLVTGDAVIINADTQAISRGKFGAAVKHAVAPVSDARRSLSAVTFCGKAVLGAADLDYHNVFFSSDYVNEFAELGTARKVPGQPTTYVCAPDFDQHGEQRLFVLVNAPANGDCFDYDADVVGQIRDATGAQLQACGLTLNLDGFEATTPNDFHARYPATGGALYGPAMHGWRAAFQRSGNCTRVPGLFVVGGSVHPGSGVPMAALSGRLCATSVLNSLAPQDRYDAAAMAAR